MIKKVIFIFVGIAVIAYYYNIDIRSVVIKSGVPMWLHAHLGLPLAPDQNPSTMATTTP